MKKMVITIISLISLLVSATIEISPEQSIAQETIRTRPGDTLLLRAGTYTGSFALEDGITLIGESPLTTIIKGNGRENCVIMGGSSSISNVSITGGNCGIQTQSAQATIKNVIITENRGTGIIVLNRMPKISNVVISHNLGNGIYGTDIGGGELILDSLSIIQNLQYGIKVTGTEPILVTNSVLFRNGIRAFDDDDTLIVANNNSIYPTQDSYESNNIPHKPTFNRDRDVRSLCQLREDSPIRNIGANLK